MQRLINLGIFLLMLMLLGACKKTEITPTENEEEVAASTTLTDPPHLLSFDIEKTNSTNDFVSSVVDFEFVEQESKWWMWSPNFDTSVQLNRTILFNAILANGDSIDFKIWFKKQTSDYDKLILTDSVQVENCSGCSLSGKWCYRSIIDERDDFYLDYGTAFIDIKRSFTTGHKSNNGRFEVSNVERCLVDGIERNYISIEFEGSAFGVYDPYGEHLEVYHLSNGRFEGVID